MPCAKPLKLFGGQSFAFEPRCIELFDGDVQVVSLAMVRLQRFDLAERRCCGLLRTHTGKERLLFVGCVALPADAEVAEGRLHSASFFFGQRACGRALHDQAQYVQELLDAAMAILQHPNWIVKSCVGLCTYLNSHSVLRSYLEFRCDSRKTRFFCMTIRNSRYAQ